MLDIIGRYLISSVFLPTWGAAEAANAGAGYCQMDYIERAAGAVSHAPQATMNQCVFNSAATESKPKIGAPKV